MLLLMSLEFRDIGLLFRTCGSSSEAGFKRTRYASKGGITSTTVIPLLIKHMLQVWVIWFVLKTEFPNFYSKAPFHCSQLSFQFFFGHPLSESQRNSN